MRIWFLSPGTEPGHLTAGSVTGWREQIVGIAVKAGAAAAASAHGRALGVATLVTWLLTVAIGAYMLSRLVARGGLRRQRASKDGLSPAVLYGHFGLALTGLAVWAGYLATGSAVLAWSAVGVLMPVIGLGISTVILWTPYPGPRGAGPAGRTTAAAAPEVGASALTDDVLASALTDDALASRLVEEVVTRVRSAAAHTARTSRAHLAPLIPAGHGVAALATFLLAVLSAAGTR